MTLKKELCVPPRTMVRGRRSNDDVVKRGIGARQRDLADPLIRNSAVRGMWDVETFKTVGRWASHANRLGGYDKMPWARECLGVIRTFSRAFSQLSLL